MKSDWAVLARVTPYLTRRWRDGLLAFLLVGACSLLGLLTPWPLKILIDNVLQGQPLPRFLASFGDTTANPVPLLVATIVAGFLLSMVQNTVEILNKYVQTRLDQELALDFRSDLFQHAQRLSLTYHSRRRSGDFLSRITTRAAAISRVGLAALPVTQSAITLVGMFTVAFFLSPQLALLSLVVVPFVYFSIGYYTRRISPRVREVREMEGESLSLAHEAMSMLRLVLAFGRESFEHWRFRNQNRVALEARLELTRRQILYSWLVNVIAAGGIGLVLGVGAYRVLEGDLTVGLLLVIVTYVGSVYTPLQTISGTVAGLQEQLLDLRLAFEILDTEPEIKNHPGATALTRCEGAIDFESVSFHYPGRQGVLHEVSFRAEPGQVLGIAGPTGAGKTTLVSLIPRFFDPSRGRILLDGLDIRRISLESLRKHVSIVLQDPLLTSGTIADNIRYGRLDAPFEAVQEAARAAHAEAFIRALPQGYDTRVGERGAELSGGERQRIAVARAFLKDAPILILDEPTAAVDSAIEALILDALERLARGRTTFVIAHRLSTISRADRILVVDQGRIVETGRYQDLLHRGGVFRSLYEAQSASAENTSARPPVRRGRVTG